MTAPLAETSARGRAPLPHGRGSAPAPGAADPAPPRPAGPAVPTPDGPVPRHGRAALLRLAGWFAAADAATAHEVYTAAFALHPATHLGGPAEDDSVAATTSWWDGPLAPTAAVRLSSALPAAPARAHGAQRARLRDAAESSAHWRRSAAQELRRVLAEPTAADARVLLSSSAMDVLMELLTAALGSGDATRAPVSAGDLELGIRLHVRHVSEAAVSVRGSGGDLDLDGLRLRVTPFAVLSDAADDDTAGDGTAAPDARPERLVRHA